MTLQPGFAAMDTDSAISRHQSSRRCLGILFLFLVLLLLPPPAAAGSPCTHPDACFGTTSISAPLPGWSWNSLFAPIQTALGNRRRMFQFATIGMCIGLYILMRK
jgi:hypothetical protein